VCSRIKASALHQSLSIPTFSPLVLEICFGPDVGLLGMSGIATACLSCLSAVDRWCHITACLGPIGGRSRDGIYETTLADNEREAVSDLLGYLENVRGTFELPPESGLPVMAIAPLSFPLPRVRH
jgi:hypothetical protein